ncbi:MAG: hypothetical protein ACM3U2_09630, partial [Deltaproteobacteria bacterium]
MVPDSTVRTPPEKAMAKKSAGSGRSEKLTLIARPDERRPAPVKKSWNRIERWLLKNLPEALANLRRGVKAADVKALEKAIGKKLPSDVVESWSIHDGED